jgi:hypothetical protein
MTNGVKRETGNAKRFRTIESGENPLLTELHRRLSEPGPWAHRFRRLAEAIVEAAGPEPTPPKQSQNAKRPSLSCEECEDLLDLYVDDELKGHDVQRLYPLIWHHLQTCPRCRQAHDLIADTLGQERDGELPPIPHLETPRFSFLRSHSADTPWISRLRSQIAGAPFGLIFSFSLPYLQTLLSPPVPVTVRTEESLPTPPVRLLLSDTVAVGEQMVVVEVTAIHNPESPNHLDLQATITSSASLPENLWARLTWADQTRSVFVDIQGRVSFGEVSLTKLQEALEAGEGSFEIAFEAGEVND